MRAMPVIRANAVIAIAALIFAAAIAPFCASAAACSPSCCGTMPSSCEERCTIAARGDDALVPASITVPATVVTATSQELTPPRRVADSSRETSIAPAETDLYLHNSAFLI